MQSLAADLIDYAHDHVVERRRKMMRERHFWWLRAFKISRAMWPALTVLGGRNSASNSAALDPALPPPPLP
jgi:hypothetical protein